MLTLTVIAQPDDECLSDSVITVPEQGGDIGRSDSCVIYLPDSSRQISRRHAELVCQGKHFFIRDWSSNGLQVNGDSLTRGTEGQQLLGDGDIVSIGCYRLLVSQPPQTSTNSNMKKNKPIKPVVYGGEAQVHQKQGTDAQDPSPTMPSSSYHLFDHQSPEAQSPAPPLLTDAVDLGALTATTPRVPGVNGFSPHGGGFTQIEPSERLGFSERLLPQSDYLTGMTENLAGINALADEILREFNPEHLQHVLRPWRKRMWHRASWWSLYRRYYEQMQRTGELHVRLREWSLRAGGLGRGGS